MGHLFLQVGNMHGTKLGKEMAHTWGERWSMYGERLGPYMGKSWTMLGEVLGRTWGRLGEKWRNISQNFEQNEEKSELEQPLR